MDEDELLKTAGNAARALEGKGLAGFDVYVRSASSTSVEVKEQKLEAFEEALTWGVGVRALLQDGRMGFAFSTGSEDAVAGAAAKAVENARSVEPDAHNNIPLPSGAPYPALVLFDDAVSGLSGPDKISFAMLVEKAARGCDPRVTKVRSASASFTEARWAIISSTGVRAASRGTYINCGVMAVAEEGGDSQMGYDFDMKRSLREMDFSSVGANAAIKAVSLLGAKKPPSGLFSVMFENTVSAEFLGVLAASFSGEAVTKGRSLLTGRVGHKICSELVSITDDGLLPDGPASKSFDDEGMPSMRTALVERGVLRGFLHNSYTAKRTNEAATGNASRAGFRSQPGVSPTNLFIGPGGETKEGLVSRVSSGLLVEEVLGMHTANPVSGDFSVGVSGQWIEGGRLAYPVREAAIAGNVLAIFSEVEALGSDLRFIGRLGAPSILLKPISVSGG